MGVVKIFIKIGLIALFIGCLQKQRYSYYEMVRAFSLIGFIALAVMDYMDKHYLSILPSIAGILLFNPIKKITFKRDIWQNIDRGIAYALAAWILIEVVYLLHNARKNRSINISK